MNCEQCGREWSPTHKTGCYWCDDWIDKCTDEGGFDENDEEKEVDLSVD